MATALLPEPGDAVITVALLLALAWRELVRVRRGPETRAGRTGLDLAILVLLAAFVAIAAVRIAVLL